VARFRSFDGLVLTLRTLPQVLKRLLLAESFKIGLPCPLLELGAVGDGGKDQEGELEPFLSSFPPSDGSYRASSPHG